MFGIEEEEFRTPTGTQRFTQEVVRPSSRPGEQRSGSDETYRSGGPQFSLSDVESDFGWRSGLARRNAIEHKLIDAQPDVFEERQQAQRRGVEELQGDQRRNRAHQLEYERMLPASLDEMNRLGVRDLTRGEAIGPMMKYGQDRRKEDFARDVEFPYRLEAERIQRQPLPGQTAIANREDYKQELRRQFDEGLQGIRRLVEGGRITSDEAKRREQEAWERFSVLSDQASGKGVSATVQKRTP